MFPPWNRPDIYFDDMLTMYGSKLGDENTLKAMADQIICNNQHALNIFTDASKQTNGSVGIGVVIRPLYASTYTVLSMRINDCVSVYKAELFAIY